MTIFCFKNFNNYYNRRLKGRGITDISDFMEEFGVYEYMQTDTFGNFDENDGVVTKQVLGGQGNPYSGNCDYLIVCNDNNTISSRWFIIDQDKKCFGQYEVDLYRDTVVDYWEVIKESPAFIEKATLDDNDPLIFNQESVTTNQIKKNEILLTDTSRMGWIVGYIAKDANSSTPYEMKVNTIADVEVSTYADISSTLVDNATANVDYFKPMDISTCRFTLYCHYLTDGGRTHNYESVEYLISGDNVVDTRTTVSSVPSGAWLYQGTPTALKTRIIEYVKPSLSNLLASIPLDFPATYDDDKYDAILVLRNKVVKTTDTGKFYKLVTTTGTSTSENNFTSTTSTFSAFDSLLNSITHTGNISGVRVRWNSSKAKYMTDGVLATQTLSTTLGTADQRIHCKDVFDMFCIPYPKYRQTVSYGLELLNGVKVKNSSDNGWNDFTFSADEALAIAQVFAEKLDANLYDLQLLPYCPLTNMSFGYNSNDNVINMDIKTPAPGGGDPSLRYRIIEDSLHNPRCIVLFSASNKGTVDLDCSNIPVLYSADNVKLVNQTQIIRLSSPNYASQFEFNVAKNKGVAFFNVDYTYLPIRPYIHVAPVWNEYGIYGKDFNDAKGLICGGDFSLSYTKDAWTNYQVQNKNFQEIFDRGTQNLETNYKYQRMQSIANVVTGTLTGGTLGAKVGSDVGGKIGAVAGAGIGAGASLAGGLIDLKVQKELHNEAMDYRQDLFTMQLDNIKALPDSLTKVTAINENNKIFPFVEIYDCTDREKIAVANKIAWNGMTVGAIGKISDYLENSWSYEGITDKGYVKAKLIRMEGIADDTHILNAIADELNRGVYTK